MELKALIFVESPKAIEAVQFYKDAFGAEEVSRSRNFHRTSKADQYTCVTCLLSVELKIGPFLFLVSDFLPDFDESAAPVKTVVKETETVFRFTTDNVEVVVENAVNAGAVLDGEYTDGYFGAGNKKLMDPYGYFWLVCAPGKMPTDIECAGFIDSQQ